MCVCLCVCVCVCVCECVYHVIFPYMYIVILFLAGVLSILYSVRVYNVSQLLVLVADSVLRGVGSLWACLLFNGHACSKVDLKHSYSQLRNSNSCVAVFHTIAPCVNWCTKVQVGCMEA